MEFAPKIQFIATFLQLAEDRSTCPLTFVMSSIQTVMKGNSNGAGELDWLQDIVANYKSCKDCCANYVLFNECCNCVLSGKGE